MAKKEAWRAREERMKRKQRKSVKERRSNEQQRRKRKTYKERMSERDARPPRCPAPHCSKTDLVSGWFIASFRFDPVTQHPQHRDSVSVYISISVHVCTLYPCDGVQCLHLIYSLFNYAESWRATCNEMLRKFNWNKLQLKLQYSI